MDWNDSLNKTAYLELAFNCVVDSQTFNLWFVHSDLVLHHALVLIHHALSLGLHVIAIWLPNISLLEWLETLCLGLWETSFVESLGLIFGSFEKLFDVSSCCFAQIFEDLLLCMVGILLLSIVSLAECLDLQILEMSPTWNLETDDILLGIDLESHRIVQTI